MHSLETSHIIFISMSCTHTVTVVVIQRKTTTGQEGIRHLSLFHTSLVISFLCIDIAVIDMLISIFLRQYWIICRFTPRHFVVGSEARPS